MALTGRVFPNPPPPEYAWVQVVSVSDESCEIDIPTEEGSSFSSCEEPIHIVASSRYHS
jgi:hypothetical protein